MQSLIVKSDCEVWPCRGPLRPRHGLAEAREHLPLILKKCGVSVEAGVLLLNSLEEIIQQVEFETYGSFEPAARLA